MKPEIESIVATQERLGGVSRTTIYTLIAAGRLHRVNLGRRAFITTESLDRLLAEMMA